MVAAANLLDVGLYSVHDAALYARLRSQMMSRWVYGSQDGKPVITPQLGEPDDKFLTFLDFVQALAIRRIRIERRVPLQKIREAYFRAKKQFNVKYPLALDSTRIGLFGPLDNPKRQEVFICLEKDDDKASQYFQLSGKEHGNQLIGEVVATYRSRLIFDEEGLAKKYVAFKSDDGVKIVMDPMHRFGEPFFEDIGYTAQTLFDAYRSEGSVQRAADVYGVDPLFVTLSVEFFDFLQPPSAT